MSWWKRMLGRSPKPEPVDPDVDVVIPGTLSLRGFSHKIVALECVEVCLFLVGAALLPAGEEYADPFECESA